VITNPSFAAYVGQTPEVLQGALGSTWFPGYLTNGVFDMYKQTYLTGVTLRKDIHYFVDQHDLYLDLLSTKIGNEVLVTFTDYTKLKKAQLQLEKLVEDLKRSNANLEEFAHAASHDMKEPIRKVLTFSDRLKSSLEPRMTEAEKNLFSRMENATQRMGILVDDLLAFSHLSERPKEMEVVDLNKKLENVLGDLELLIDEKGATIDIGSLPVVKGHRRQLQQLFQNLIGNALKYSKPNIDPVITITCEEVLGKDSPIHKLVESDDRSFYWIQVRDNGIGFEQQYAERIFAMFQRLHGKSEYAGTGVGLSIARKVVENHNGYIWAQSEPGAGATFHVLLPV
jgi:light-regulated signal transduction histidine kinase (bacteriophytochrome)